MSTATLDPVHVDRARAMLEGQTIHVLDTETTGFKVQEGARLIEIARLTLIDGQLVSSWSSLIDAGVEVPEGACKVHGVCAAMLRGMPTPKNVARRLRDDVRGTMLCFHNAPFDVPFVNQFLVDGDSDPLTEPIIDTLGLARGVLGYGNSSLAKAVAALDIPPAHAHRAFGDALTTARLLVRILPRFLATCAPDITLAEVAALSNEIVRRKS